MSEPTYGRAGGGVYWHILSDGATICGFKPSGNGAKSRGRWAAFTRKVPHQNLIHPQCARLAKDNHHAAV